MEKQMNATPVTDLALRHILESGLAVVKGEQLEPTRKGFVLKALGKIFDDARKGSHALTARNFFLAAEEPPVLERFSLFFRYLHGTMGDDLSTRLDEVAGVLGELETNGEAEANAKARAAQLIENLLAGIAQESALAPLVPQQDAILAF
jgi:hypothetical protein